MGCRALRVVNLSASTSAGSGRAGNTVFDMTNLRDYVNEVERYCLQNQDMTVMNAAETVLSVNK